MPARKLVIAIEDGHLVMRSFVDESEVCSIRFPSGSTENTVRSMAVANIVDMYSECLRQQRGKL